MPEGDTIALIASRLAPVLEAREITRFEAPRLSGDLPGVGERVEAVQPQGKYLTISFSGGLSVQTHLGMVGSWHLYSHDETWQRPASQARLIVETSERVAVCFRVPTVRVFASGRHDPLSHLGPDLCLALVDIDTIVRRARELGDPAADIATIVLDQRRAIPAPLAPTAIHRQSLRHCSARPRAEIGTQLVMGGHEDRRQVLLGHLVQSPSRINAVRKEHLALEHVADACSDALIEHISRTVT